MAAEMINAIPILPVLDLSKALAFYTSRLGFNTIIDLDDYAGVERGAVQIHFWLCDDPNLPANSSCRIGVMDIDTLYEEYVSAGVIQPNEALTDQPWGYREFTALDPFGNALIFAEERP